MDLTNIFRTFHPNAEECCFSSSAHGTFSRRNHILGHKSSLSKFKKTEISILISDKIDIKTKILQKIRKATT